MMEKILINWPIKLISLIFSISLWFYVVQGTNPIRTREFNNIPVTIKNQEYLDLTIVEPENPTVSFRVKGRRNTLNNMRRSDIEVVADMNGVTGTTASVELFYHIPDEVSIVERSHSAIVFSLDKQITVAKKIEINRIGELPYKNLEISSIDLNMDTVNITGYSRKIDKIKKAIVDLNLDEIIENSEIKGKVKILDNENREMDTFELSINEVILNVKLKETKEVLIKPVIENEPLGFNIDNIQLNQDKVIIKGPSDIIKDITEIKTNPINLEGITKTTTFDTKLDMPEEVVLVENSNIQAKVILSERPTEITDSIMEMESRIFDRNNSDIQIKNLSNSKEINYLDNNSFKVTIFGEENIINQIKDSDIYISIDVKDLNTGEYELPILINEINGIKRVTITPGKLRIVIK